MSAADQERVRELVRSLQQLTGCSVMLCSPDCSIITFTEDSVQLQQGEAPLREKIVRYISENLSQDLSVQTLCRLFAVSKSELYRLLRSYAPGGVASYVRKMRIAKACELLRTTQSPMWKIAVQVGYENPDYFLRAFKKEVGVCAGKYRKSAQEQYTAAKAEG